MTKTRLEAFSDGVIAILITIMILELHVPEGHDVAALKELAPSLLTYLLSFVYLGIYWTNHHHLLHACERINGKILWANLHLLFWLSLVPFATAWMDESHLASLPTAIYGVCLLMSSVAWLIMLVPIKAIHGPDSLVARATIGGWKENLSTLLYIAAIPLAFVRPWISAVLFSGVALMWLVPDVRIESKLEGSR